MDLAPCSRAYHFETPRVGFGTWEGTPRDADLAWRLWGNPDVTRLFLAEGSSLGRDATDAKLAAEVAQGRDFGVQYWPIFARASGAFLGACGLRPFTRWPQFDAQRLAKTCAGRGATVGGGDVEYEAGIHLLPAAWGRGYAREALGAVLDVVARGDDGFGRQVRGVIAGHHPRNVASSKVLQGLGFHWYADVFYAPTGLRHPHYVWRRPEAVWPSKL